jgi:hypothetical protein
VLKEESKKKKNYLLFTLKAKKIIFSLFGDQKKKMTSFAVRNAQYPKFW